MRSELIEAIRSEQTARLLAIPVAVLLGSLACSSSGPTAPGSRALTELPLTMETEHFSLRYQEQDQGVIADYATVLEANYDRIVNDFLMTEVPRVTARFYHDQQAFTAATGHANLGRTLSSSIFALVAQPLNLDGALHEFTHCVTLVFFKTSYYPSWLFESVALYEADQLVAPSTVACLANREFPSIPALGLGGSCSVYPVGYTIAEFIVETWGRARLRALILSHGDVPGVLGVPWSDFQSGWEAFVTDRYL